MPASPPRRLGAGRAKTRIPTYGAGRGRVRQPHSSLGGVYSGVGAGGRGLTRSGPASTPFANRSGMREHILHLAVPGALSILRHHYTQITDRYRLLDCLQARRYIRAVRRNELIRCFPSTRGRRPFLRGPAFHWPQATMSHDAASGRCIPSPPAVGGVCPTGRWTHAPSACLERPAGAASFVLAAQGGRGPCDEPTWRPAGWASSRNPDLPGLQSSEQCTAWSLGAAGVKRRLCAQKAVLGRPALDDAPETSLIRRTPGFVLPLIAGSMGC